MSHSQKLQFYLKEEFLKTEIGIFLGITAHVLEVLNKSDKRVWHKKASNEQNTLCLLVLCGQQNTAIFTMSRQTEDLSI